MRGFSICKAGETKKAEVGKGRGRLTPWTLELMHIIYHHSPLPC